MKRLLKNPIAILLVTLLIFSFCSCEDKGDTPKENSNTSEIKLGVWEDNVFTNEWANYSFVLPNDMEKLSYEELQSLQKGLEEQMLFVNGDSEKTDSEYTYTYVDFVLKDSNGAVSVCSYFQDVQKATYIDMTAGSLAERIIAAYEEQNYESTDVQVTSIGQVDGYISFSVKMNEYTATTYYIKKIDSYFNIWIVNEYERQSSDVGGFVKAVERGR